MNNYKTRLMEQRAKNTEKIKEQISIMDLAPEYGLHIKKHGARLFSLVEHPSCVIYPETNTFCYWSSGVGGDVFKFLETFNECGHLAFNDAYKELVKKIDGTIELTTAQKQERKMKIDTLKDKQAKSIHLRNQLENIDDHCKNIMAYLIKERKIDPGIVYEMIDKNMIKQQTNNYGSKNIIFLGYDENGMLASAQYRGCSSTSTSRGDFENCNYDYGWLYEPNINNSSFCPDHDWTLPLVCLEGNIDMMAFQSLIKSNELLENDYSLPDCVRKLLASNEKSYKNFNYHVCGSVMKKNSILKLQEKFGIKEFIIGFDRDAGGIKASNELKDQLLSRGCTVHQVYSNEKDWDKDRQCLSEKKSLNQRIQHAKEQKQQPSKSTKKEIEISR